MFLFLFFKAAITFFRMYIKQLSFAVSWKSAPTFLLTRVVTQFLLTYKRRLCHICRFRSFSVVASANFFVAGPCNGFEISVFAFSFQRLYLIVTCIPTVQFLKGNKVKEEKKNAHFVNFFTCTLFGQLLKEETPCAGVAGKGIIVKRNLATVCSLVCRCALNFSRLL